jgi:hypothetical protein
MIKKNDLLVDNCIEEIGFNNLSSLENEDLIFALHKFSIDWIANTKPSQLPCNPMPEKHPYKSLMPLNTKFNKFIIGTFPPISYFSDTFDNIKYCNGIKLSKPNISFYHGNRLMLWKYLLNNIQFGNLSSDRSIKRNQIINFLIENRINYCDIIDFCQRLDYNADDANLYNIILNDDLLNVIKSDQSDLLFVFNTGSLFTNGGMNFTREGKLNPKTFVFDMFVELMINNGFEVKIRIGDIDPILINHVNKKKLSGFTNILRFDILVNDKVIKVVAGPSPADGDGKLLLNQIFKRFKNKINPNINYVDADVKRRFKSYVYQTALLGNPDDLYSLNFD